MAEDGSARQYQQLRNAAVEVLTAARDVEGQLPETFRSALESLRDTLRGETAAPPAEGQPPVLDPFVHYLTSRHYEGNEPGKPIPLEKMASDLRHELDNDRGIHDRPPGEEAWNVTVTELRGMIIGSLLEELAARLSPGAAFGPGKNGEKLARIALELSKELYDQTFVGSQ